MAAVSHKSAGQWLNTKLWKKKQESEEEDPLGWTSDEPGSPQPFIHVMGGFKAYNIFFFDQTCTIYRNPKVLMLKLTFKK